MSSFDDIAAAGRRIAEGQVVAVDNDAVWALWGDAAADEFVDQVQAIKSREPERRFGLTLPFSHVASYADYDRIHPGLHPLFTYPEDMTALLGGLAFLKLPADEAKLHGSSFSDVVVSYDRLGKPVLQNYDPTGKRNIELLVAEAIAAGANLPAATSMNASGEKEIVDHDRAAAFIGTYGLKAYIDSRAARLGTGSYAILDITPCGFELVREGNISVDIIRRLLDGYPFVIAADCKKAKGEPLGGFSGYYGKDLRSAIVAARQWNAIPSSSAHN